MISDLNPVGVIANSARQQCLFLSRNRIQDTASEGENSLYHELTLPGSAEVRTRAGGKVLHKPPAAPLLLWLRLAHRGGQVLQCISCGDIAYSEHALNKDLNMLKTTQDIWEIFLDGFVWNSSLKSHSLGRGIISKLYPKATASLNPLCLKVCSVNWGFGNPQTGDGQADAIMHELCFDVIHADTVTCEL